jgi:DNA-binding phage protein
MRLSLRRNTGYWYAGKGISKSGNPTLKTTLAVMNALGIQLSARMPEAA